MEVVVPPAMDFDFNSPAQPSPSPYLSAPSSPKLCGDYYFSAPTSPRRLSEFYSDFDDFSVMISSPSVPFDWEEKPGTPKSPKGSKPGFEDDFAFDVGGEELEKTTLPAEELFDGGKIRPLKPPPQLQVKTALKETGTTNSSALSPRSPRSPISNFRGAFSPRRKKETDPFAAAVENTRKRREQDRGRERVASLSSSSSGRRGARSLSPYRVSKYPWEEEEQNLQQQKTKQSSTTSSSRPALSPTASSISSSSAKGCRKWKLKDFFLFRSASEGRAADKDPLKKYSALFRKHEDIRHSSFRSIEGSNKGSSSKRRGAVSPHEMHYAVNRAVSEDLKKKTFLPYKQGILGRLAFNPAVHALANGFGFSRK